MPALHHSDVFAYRLTQSFGMFAKAINMENAGIRADSLWSTINQEDLLKPRTLPLMLNSRGRNHPSAFAGIDRTEMSVGLRWFAFVPVSVPNHVMLLNRIDEHNAKEDYGTIVGRDLPDGHPVSSTAPILEKQYLVGEGLLILEVQEKILQFLVDCCHAILHDIAPEDVAGPQYPVQPEPKLKEESESAGFESLQVLAQEAPYRAPTHLDLGRVVSLLTARAKAAEDHLWSLREDPSYFHETLLEYVDHRTDIFWGNPDGSDANRVVYWSEVLKMLLMDAYRDLETFEELRRQAVELLALHTKDSAQIHPARDLPLEWLEAILRFRTHLWQAVSGHFKQIENGAIPSPPLRHLFWYSEAQEGILSVDNMNKVEDSVVWLLKTLYEDGDDLSILGLTKTMDGLDHLISGKPEAKKLISSYVGRAIGDLSIVAQCYRQLELYQPWAQEFDYEAAKRDQTLKNEYFAWQGSWTKIAAAFAQDALKPAGRLADPHGGKFVYPVDRRPSKDNVDKLRRAEANLDGFWRCVDRLIHVKLPGMQGSFSGKFLVHSRILKRTPEWVERQAPLQKQKSQPLPPQLESYEPLSAFYTEFGQPSSSTRRPDLSSQKQKVKTKGVARPSTDAAATANTPVTETEQPSISIPVDARSLKVFRALFFNPDITSTPGEIPWNSFLHAMTSTGFVAEKLYGSVWQFRPDLRPADNKSGAVHVANMEQAIQFHEPHPKPKIPFTTATRFGRRLFRQYGWIGSMFVLNK